MIRTNIVTANSEFYYILQGRGKPDRAILWHHGAGGETTMYEPIYGQLNGRALFDRLVKAGFTIVCADFGGENTWANTANQTKITQAVNWLGTIGCRTDKVGLWGLSMGFLCLSAWARNNTSKVAALAGTIPAANGQWIYSNSSLAGVGGVMDAAWSGNWVANGKPTTDPSVIYASLTSFPVSLWYASDDNVVGSSTATSLATSINGAGGNATAISMGTGGHTDTPLAAVDSAAFTLFFEQGNW